MQGLAAGLWNNGQGAVDAIRQLSSAAPGFVSTLTHFSTNINQELNGTDTPNIPSLFFKGGQKLFEVLTAVQQGQNPKPPRVVQVETVPGPDGILVKRPPSFEHISGNYYPAPEGGKRPPRPVRRPPKPRPVAGSGNVERLPTPQPGHNYFLHNVEHRIPPTTIPGASAAQNEALPDLPSFEDVLSKFQVANNQSLAIQNGPLATRPLPPRPPTVLATTLPYDSQEAVEVGDAEVEDGYRTTRRTPGPDEVNTWVARKPGGSAVSEFIKAEALYKLPSLSYVPSVVSLHEEGPSVGPQTNKEDTFNGLTNKTPYQPVKNGVLVDTPSLTPSPLVAANYPSVLYVRRRRRRSTTTPTTSTTTTTSDPEYYEEWEYVEVSKL